MANFVSILALRPQEQYEKKKVRTLKDKLPKSVGAESATGDQWRTNSRKIEETKPKQKHHPIVDVTGDGTKVQCCKEHCIGTWIFRSRNQGKLEQLEADRTYAISKIWRGSQEEICHVHGQEGWPRGGMPCPRLGAAAERRYAMSKVRSGGRE